MIAKLSIHKLKASSIAGAFALLALANGCSETPSGKVEAASERAPIVAVVRVSRESIKNEANLEAELEPYQEVDIRAKVAGYVRTLGVDIGSRVKQGQLLASLEVPELQSDRDQAIATVKRREAEVQRAQDQLRLAQAGFEVARLTYQRLDSVNKTHPGLVAEQEVDDALAKDRQAEAQVSADEAALAAAQAALTEALGNRSRVQAMLDYSHITAPFSGVITKRYVSVGTMVPAGTSSSTQAAPVVRIAQTDPLRLVIYLPAFMVPNVRVGKMVTIEIPTVGRAFELPIRRMADAVDVASRTMRIEVDVPNPKMELAPGEYANVSLPVESRLSALVVPTEAVVRNGTETSVWIVKPDHRMELRQVSVGVESPDKVEIVSGVSEADLVAIGQTSRFQAGEKVVPKTVELAGIKP